MMNIEDIDFNELYKLQLLVKDNSEKSQAKWNSRAKKFSQMDFKSKDSYTQKLIEYIDFTGATTLLDVGCGIGNISLEICHKMREVHALDFSYKMLQYLKLSMNTENIHNITTYLLSWEDSWSSIPNCDISVASRSTLVSDLATSLIKLNNITNKRVYTTHTVNPTFIKPEIIEAINRPIIEKPTYIYAVNILNRLGLRPEISYITSNINDKLPQNFAEFKNEVEWSLGKLDSNEVIDLKAYYNENEISDFKCTNDWAIVSWNVNKIL